MNTAYDNTDPARPKKQCRVCRQLKHLNHFGANGQSDTCMQCAMRESDSNKGWARSQWRRT
jgi:hypothetical protein